MAEQCVCSRLRDGRGTKLGGVSSSLRGRARLSRLKRRVRNDFQLMSLIDTQILSYWFKGRYPEISKIDFEISSITANEFLLVQNMSDFKRANYYIPLLSHMGGSLLYKGIELPSLKSSTPRAKRSARRHTDQIILEFGNDYPIIVEYGSLALSDAINNKLYELYLQSIQTLPKDKQKYLKQRFKYIITNSISSIPLNKNIIEIGFDLLIKFTEKYKPKDNIRNTINDILILSTAIAKAKKIITDDKLLNRFASEEYQGKIEVFDRNLIINFESTETLMQKNNKESKGYINRGWQIKERKGQI